MPEKYNLNEYIIQHKIHLHLFKCVGKKKKKKLNMYQCDIKDEILHASSQEAACYSFHSNHNSISFWICGNF